MKSRRGGSWADSLQNMIGMNGTWKPVRDDGAMDKTTKGGRRTHRNRMGTKSVKGRKVGTRSKRGRVTAKKGSKKMRGGQHHWYTKLGVGVHKFSDPAGYMVETDQIPEYNVGLPDALTMGRLQS